MRSLHAAILLVMLGILTLSFLVFRSISEQMERAYFNPVFDKMDELEIESASAALDQGGVPALSAYMRRLDSLFRGKHYLLDAQGVDLVNGANQAALLPKPPASSSREQQQDRIVVTHRANDGRYWFIAVSDRDRSRPWMFFPYYLLVAGVIVLLYWLAAVGLVSPIRKVSRSAESFGRGDLAARVITRRPDEIGDLARSFNQMADRLETLITSERRLLQDVSHELRSPLARLKLATKLARTSSDHQAALDRIERDLDRMTSLMNDIVEITRMEGDPSAPELTDLNLDSLIDSIVEDCRIEAETHGCFLAVSGGARHPVRGNGELLRRAIENVVRNAISYSPPGSLVEIFTSEASGMAQIQVRDHGPGVPPELCTRLFEPFFRVEKARDTLRGGTGLGLSIASRAIQLHRGTITAKNAGPGLQVTMSLPLPANPSATVSVPPQSRGDGLPGGSGDQS
jgi:signal transduction histidine kinase